MCQRLSRKKNRERVKVSENENGTPGRSQDLAYGETGKVVTDSKATEVVKEDGVQLSRMPKEIFTYFFSALQAFHNLYARKLENPQLSLYSGNISESSVQRSYN